MAGSRRTTAEIRDLLRTSKAPAAELARQFGINPKTVLKWRHRSDSADLRRGPRQARSTVLSLWEEAALVLFRHFSALPLDDLLTAAHPVIPHLTRSSLHRLLRRHGLARRSRENEAVPPVLLAMPLDFAAGHFVLSAALDAKRLSAILLPQTSWLSEAGTSPDPVTPEFSKSPLPGLLAPPSLTGMLPEDDRRRGLRQIAWPGAGWLEGAIGRALAASGLDPAALAARLEDWVEGYNGRPSAKSAPLPPEADAGPSVGSKPPAARTRAATIRDVAARVGVSAMTVSRVINGDPDVKATTRQRVRQAIEDLNYIPNTSARRLVGARVIQIGLLHGNPSAAYLGELLAGAIEEAGPAGHHLVLERCRDDGRDAVRHLIARELDGVILPPPFSDMEDLRRQLQAAGIAALALGTIGEKAVPSVSVDDRAAAYAMTRHLIALGHRDIAFIKGHPNQTASRLRLEGFLTAMREAGLACPPERVAQGYFSYDSGIAAARQLLDRPVPPTAVFASNDDMAAATMAIAYQRGLRIPQDLSVAGFDDTLAATMCWPALTTVRQPIATMARQAVLLLADSVRRADGTEGGHLTVPFTIIERDSCAPQRNNRR